MSEVIVVRIPEEHRPSPEAEFVLSIGMQTSLLASEIDAKKLRDTLCIMLGRPGKAGRAKRKP